MQVDCLFLDAACHRGYTWLSLEEDSIGGTESSTIRLAEGFASKGLSVVVITRFGVSAQTSPNGVIYAPWHWVNTVKPKNVIHLRHRGYFDKFVGARQFAWLHDAAGLEHNNMSGWESECSKYGVQCISVSNWHTNNILSIAPKLPVKRIYSPVDEVCYSYPRPDKVDVNQLVWMSSPHKGLSEAIDVFQDIRAQAPEMKLVVFNPGYYKESPTDIPGVVFVPECKKSSMRSVVSQSLCLFYPTMFEETFGLVAAECNALGRPVACFPVAALAESCGNEFCKDLDDLKAKVLAWRTNSTIYSGQDCFKFESIWLEWKSLLA